MPSIHIWLTLFVRLNLRCHGVFSIQYLLFLMAVHFEHRLFGDLADEARRVTGQEKLVLVIHMDEHISAHLEIGRKNDGVHVLVGTFFAVMAVEDAHDFARTQRNQPPRPLRVVIRLAVLKPQGNYWRVFFILCHTFFRQKFPSIRLAVFFAQFLPHFNLTIYCSGVQDAQ